MVEGPGKQGCVDIICLHFTPNNPYLRFVFVFGSLFFCTFPKRAGASHTTNLALINRGSLRPRLLRQDYVWVNKTKQKTHVFLSIIIFLLQHRRMRFLNFFPMVNGSPMLTSYFVLALPCFLQNFVRPRSFPWNVASIQTNTLRIPAFCGLVYHSLSSSFLFFAHLPCS